MKKTPVDCSDLSEFNMSGKKAKKKRRDMPVLFFVTCLRWSAHIQEKGSHHDELPVRTTILCFSQLSKYIYTLG